MVRGEVFRLTPRAPRGHEQSGARYAVVVQADEFLHLSTTLVVGRSAGRLEAHELRAVDEALALVLDL